MKNINWNRILTILLVILAAYAVLYVTGTILLRFRSAILLFVLGAIVAYILTPLVNWLERTFRRRWLAILLSYLAIAAAFMLLGVLLFTPFVQQSQSLINNLRNPSTSSLIALKQVREDASALRSRMAEQNARVALKGNLTAHQVSNAKSAIASLDAEVNALRHGTVVGAGSRPSGPESKEGRQPPNPGSQTGVPPSYVNSISAPLMLLSDQYKAATRDRTAVDPKQFATVNKNAGLVAQRTASVYHTMTGTPILLLHGQGWLDQHGIGIDLHSKFGQVANQVSDQGTNILDNAITILSETANILLNTIMILIISIYMLGDGRRLIRGSVALLPQQRHAQAWYFIGSLDRVLGGYIRGQIFLSTLAGVLAGGGAAALGVPYPLLIGLMTAILEAIPVIGPMVAIVPTIAISLVFNSIVTTVILVIWFMVYQQIVTNVIGPRIMGMAVGIHPLEALAAVLVGYPLGGLLGAFLAVPLAGIVHILVREAYAYFVLGRELPSAPMPASVMDVDEQVATQAGAQEPEARSAPT